MKERKVENNPIVRQQELSDFVSKKDTKWIKNYIKKILEEEGDNKPDWLVNLIKEVVEAEIKRHLTINMSGYSTIRTDLRYKGSTIASTTKYIHRA